MKLSNGIVKGLAVIFLLVGAAQAETNALLDTTALNATPSVLPLGARVVAGDAAKNEFFIVGKQETKPVEMIVTKHTRVIADKSMTQKIKAASKHIQVVASKKDISKIKLALNQPTHKVHGKKNKHHIVAKKKMPKVEVALNQVHTKKHISE